MIFKKLDLVNFDQISAISKFITPLPIGTKIARAKKTTKQIATQWHYLANL
ncbi:hypothetical protein [Campylobacter concisus]|uniref:Uncharacterized protein n=1 Tax=Campylobacter concisus TaxID=199 RepID=A0A7S9RFE1_9BACT|nr:hypothetical protein [Campylobacter concisus]QPH90760.1 hypothetical protein CVT00_04285 [Campylobacter concisus]